MIAPRPTPTDEAGIIAHARALAAELGPGDPAATLLALATQAERLHGRLTAARAVNAQQTRQLTRLRRAALRLRDAWRAGRVEAARTAWLERVAAKVVSYLNGHERTYETALLDVLEEEPKP